MQINQNPFSDRGSVCRSTGARVIRLAWLVLLVAAWGSVSPATAQPTSPVGATAVPAALLEELRGGGFVIYMRHTSTVLAGGDEQIEDLGRCDTQRNLSDKGRSDARLLRMSFRALGIPVGSVLVSPYCRTKETAALAFGEYTEDPDLGFVMGTNADETRRRAQSLRQMLGSVPEKGRNSAIVSHSANLYEAAGIFAKPEGAVYIFKPLGGGRFEAVARVLPDEWIEAAKKVALWPARANGAAAK